MNAKVEKDDMNAKHGYGRLGRTYFEDAPEYMATYKTRDYSGIAWAVCGWEVEPDEDTDWSGMMNRTGKLVLCMIGDDRAFTYAPDEILEIPEESYCSGCGQIGCGHSLKTNA